MQQHKPSKPNKIGKIGGILSYVFYSIWLLIFAIAFIVLIYRINNPVSIYDNEAKLIKYSLLSLSLILLLVSDIVSINYFMKDWELGRLWAGVSGVLSGNLVAAVFIFVSNPEGGSKFSYYEKIARSDESISRNQRLYKANRYEFENSIKELGIDELIELSEFLFELKAWRTEDKLVASKNKRTKSKNEESKIQNEQTYLNIETDISNIEFKINKTEQLISTYK